MASTLWTACSRVAMRGMQGPVVPQQGHVPWMWQEKGLETRRVLWSQTVAWPQQGGGSSGDVAYPVNKPKAAAQALALAPQQGAREKASALPEACLRTLENEVQKEEVAMKQAQPLGEDGPSAGQISSCCRIWREGDGSTAEGSRELRASTGGGDASPDRPGDAHARSPRCQ